MDTYLKWKRNPPTKRQGFPHLPTYFRDIYIKKHEPGNPNGLSFQDFRPRWCKYHIKNLSASYTGWQRKDTKSCTEKSTGKTKFLMHFLMQFFVKRGNIKSNKAIYPFQKTSRKKQISTARLTGGLVWGYKPLSPASVSRRWLSLMFKPLCPCLFRCHRCGERITCRDPWRALHTPSHLTYLS